MSETSTSVLSLLADYTSRPVFVVDTSLRSFLFVNKAFEKDFGQAMDNKLDTVHFKKLLHADDRAYVLDTLGKLLRDKEPRELEFRVQLPEEKKDRWLCVSVNVADDAGRGPLLVGLVEDITISRQYNDYLNKFTSKKDSALHMLAHDLSGPLGIIHSLSAELTEEVKQYGSQNIAQLIDIISRTSESSLNMIRGLINNEFLETTGVDMVKRRVNLVVAFDEVIAQYRTLAADIGKKFVFHHSEETIYAAIDDVKYMQAINNLISNAIKFTPKGGTITVSLEERDSSVLVKVADTGIGIAEKYHDTLFDKFTNARRPGLNGEPTTGLGMSIIKTIVEWHNGEIWFESEEGKGTTFYVETPKE